MADHLFDPNPGEVAPVRLFFPFSTTERNGFKLHFDPDSQNNSVQVTAVDTFLVRLDRLECLRSRTMAVMSRKP